MKKNLKIFLFLSKMGIKTSLQNRVGAIFFLIGKVFRFVVFFVFIYFLLSKTKLLAGYNLNQMLIFFLTYNFIETITQLLFREVYRFRGLIVNGEFDTVLIKPYHPFIRILIGGIDILDFITLIPYLGLLIFFISKLGYIGLFNIITFVSLIINSIIIATAFHIIVLALGIFTTEVDHTIMVYRDITRMAAIPIDIYKEPIRSFLTFIIPIGVMMTFPVKSLFGLLSYQFILISFIISIITVIFALWLWNNALKKYQSWGG